MAKWFDSSSTGRSILLAALVGVLAGLFAIAFHVLVVLLTRTLLTDLGGFQPGGPANETFLHDHNETLAQVQAFRPWAWVLLPLAGGLVNGFLIQKYELMAAGHGTGAAIRAFHQGTPLRRRLPFAKMITSAITLGTGGSGGREGPIAEIGAAVGYWVSEVFKVTAAERRRLMLAGVGAGVGAIFHAPLAGAIFAIEVLYRDPDFEAEALIPAFVASVVAYSVFSFAFGIGSFEPLFAVDAAALALDRPLTMLPALTALAVAMAGASWVFSAVYAKTESLFGALKVNPMFKPMIGGGLVGVLATVLYLASTAGGEAAQTGVLAVMGTGYGLLQGLLTADVPSEAGASLNSLPVGMLVTVLLVVGLGKIVTTALTSGSGGSGGVFGPSMVIGGSLGGVVGLLLHSQFPEAIPQDAVLVFVILGMASFFSAAASTPVSTLIMVSELTNGYALLLPAMWVCAISYVLSTKWSVYREQVANRRASPAHRGDFIVDVMQGLSVRDAIGESHKSFKAVPMATPLDELSRMMATTFQHTFPVLDEDGALYGVFSLNDIRAFLYESGLGPLAIAQDVASEGIEPLELSMSLTNAIARFATSRFDELPVVDAAEPTVVVAMLRRQDLLTLYNQTLMKLRSTERDDAKAAT